MVEKKLVELKNYDRLPFSEIVKIIGEKTEGRKIMTSEDMSINYYHVVTGKTFR